MDDLLVRVDAQTAQFEAKVGGTATRSTLQLEAALKRANTQLALAEKQMATYGRESTQAQAAIGRAAMSNARLLEQQAAIQAKAAAEQRAALQAQASAYQRLGRTYATVGAGLVLALGASAKAAIDWEQAFTRVRQALDGSPEQIAQVEDGLRDLARTLPVTHDQLAEIARDASQLGVATPNIVSFTKVVAELSTTAPDLEDGATALARFLNVTGTSQAQVENVASTLTKLGQAGASTVSEIADLGLRLAGAGRTAELTDGEILGLANAMTSLGLRVETAGTNFSKTLLTINTAVGAGGKSLRQFADIAGVSADQFARAYKDDAAQAIILFLKGLDRIKNSGGDVASTLAGLGITSQRQVDVLNRLSQNTDLVTESLQTGNQAFKDNTALQETFGKQAETNASRMQVAANNVHDLGIEIGQTLLPALGDAAGLLSDITGVLGGLPGPAKDVAAALLVAAAAVTTFSGASLLLRGRLIEMRLAADRLEGATLPALSTRLVALRTGSLAAGRAIQEFGSKAAGTNQQAQILVGLLSGAAIGGATGNPLGIIIGATIGALTSMGDATNYAAQQQARLDQVAGGLTSTLNRETGAVTAKTFQVLSTTFQDVTRQATESGIALDTLARAATGTGPAFATVSAALGVTKSDLQGLIDIANRGDLTTGFLDNLARSGNAAYVFDGAVQNLTEDQLALIVALATGTGALNQSRDAARLNAYAHGGLDATLRSAAGTQGDFKDEVYGTHDALEQQKNATDDAKDALASYNSELARFLGKQIGVHQAIIDSVKAAKEQKAGFDLNTQAGIDNTNVLLNLQSALQNVDSSTKSGARSFNEIATAMVNFQHEQGRSIPEAKAHAAALLGVDAAALKIKKDGNVVVHVQADTSDADRKLTAVQRLVQGLDGATADITVRAIIQTAQSQAAAYAARSGSWTGGYTGDGGKYEPAGIVHRGEFVFDKDSTQRIGPDRLMAQMRAARGYASGGLVGYADGGHVLTVQDLLRLVAGGDQAASLAQVNRLFHERVLAEREYAQAQKDLQRVRQDSTHTDKELADAEKAVSKARDDEREATDKWRQAQQQLVEQTKAAAAQYAQLGSAFGGEGTSLSAQGLLSKKRGSASDAREFARGLGIIKRKGADKDIIAEFKAEGPTQDALTLLRDLIRQPPSYFKQLAHADTALGRADRAAAVFGIPGAKGTQIQTQIQRQVVVHQHGVHLGPTIRQIKKAARDGAEHGLLIAGAP
jgi:TP901 family phage tail tape measure protein